MRITGISIHEACEADVQLIHLTRADAWCLSIGELDLYASSLDDLNQLVNRMHDAINTTKAKS
jgi:hypothetical protein